MIVIDDGCVSLATQDSNWVIDPSASFHVTSHSDFFTSYRTGDFGNVRMGTIRKKTYLNGYCHRICYMSSKLPSLICHLLQCQGRCISNLDIYKMLMHVFFY